MARKAGTKKAPQLTERELDVLRGIADGLTNAQIGQRIDVSYETVKTYINRLRTKLGVRTKTAIAVYAVKHKLLGAA
jgi:DNA-binding NarL/FixJ family response regulator